MGRTETTLTVERLARALYETDSGHDGYPPLHKTVVWDDLLSHRIYLDRAREVIQKIEAAR